MTYSTANGLQDNSIIDRLWEFDLQDQQILFALYYIY